MAFAQVVIGPPGSGKTTYCTGMKEFLTQLGRKVAIVNLDPANDFLPYEPAINLSELITLEDVMDKLELGPNGGLVYCMEYLEQNIDWLQERLQKLSGHYILFDCPGQVELYTHHTSIHNIMKKLEAWNYRLAAVHLVDSHYISDPGKYVAILLTSLATMMQLALPHINVLSKMDLVEEYGRLAFNLDFYTDVLDLTYLLDYFGDHAFFQQYKELNRAMCDLVTDSGLVSFVPLQVQDKESMMRVASAVDKANGYCFGSIEGVDISAFTVAMKDYTSEPLEALDIQEKFIDSKH
eukprot:comp82925_c0_seq1/m.48422 comp82925_c0_seq1/g.48422  ORF comp82925_c0_seq1/g.48422 comp82925_c0_seq1/m.48422 type:complete len:294 (-) comp82925_c0_seq1:206-1087(-)